MPTCTAPSTPPPPRTTAVPTRSAATGSCFHGLGGEAVRARRTGTHNSCTRTQDSRAGTQDSPYQNAQLAGLRRATRRTTTRNSRVRRPARGSRGRSPRARGSRDPPAGVHPRPQSADLAAGDVLAQLVAERPAAVERGTQLAQRLEHLRASSAARPSPTAPCAACARRAGTARGRPRRSGRRRPASTCPPLRSALLTTHVERRHRLQLGDVGVHEHRRLAAPVAGPQHAQPAGRHLRRRQDVDELALVVGVHPDLHHPGAERPVAQQRRRDDVPTRRPRRSDGWRPRARPACRPGSPRAVVRRGPACRRTAAPHRLR